MAKHREGCFRGLGRREHSACGGPGGGQCAWTIEGEVGRGHIEGGLGSHVQELWLLPRGQWRAIE